MIQIFEDCISKMDDAFVRIEQHVPPPKPVPSGDSYVFRYREKTIEQCIVAKLSKTITSLRGCLLLHIQGLYQEQAVLQRVVDELCEDTTFLLFGIYRGEVEKLHLEYLEYFYQEDFTDHNNPMGSLKPKPMVSRQKIRAYLSRIEESDIDPSTSVSAHKTLHQVYSGFVHGGAAQILDSYGGNPPRFHTEGMKGTPRQLEYEIDLKNYFFRSIVCFGLTSIILRIEDLQHTLFAFKSYLEKEFGVH